MILTRKSDIIRRVVDWIFSDLRPRILIYALRVIQSTTIRKAFDK